jgi:hypothetical protein
MMQNQTPQASARGIWKKNRQTIKQTGNCLCHAMQLQCWGKNSQTIQVSEMIAITKGGDRDVNE